MPRALTAVFLCGAGLYMLAGMPAASASATGLAAVAGIEKTEDFAVLRSGAGATVSNSTAGGEQRMASHLEKEQDSKPQAGNAEIEPGGEAGENSEKPPARQVPVESAETPGDQNESEASGEGDDAPGGESGAKPGTESAKDSGQSSPDAEAAIPAPGTIKRNATVGPHEKKSEMHPGLPVRKPPKPDVRRAPAKSSAKKPPSSKTARDKVLCRALQACRNSFRKCKDKIKYPDQSEPWIIAKEECGAVYKTCVEKDFRSGEWTLTRWFYFGELQCK